MLVLFRTRASTNDVVSSSGKQKAVNEDQRENESRVSLFRCSFYSAVRG